MIYEVSNEFTKINETSGTLQNSSSINTVEMSHNGEINSGILVYPFQKIAFNNMDVWIRCINGSARVRVVPFKLKLKSGVANASSVYINGNNYNIAEDGDIDDILNNIFN